jgi:hypothetical protein
VGHVVFSYGVGRWAPSNLKLLEQVFFAGTGNVRNSALQIFDQAAVGAFRLTEQSRRKTIHKQKVSNYYLTVRVCMNNKVITNNGIDTVFQNYQIECRYD